MDMTADSYRQSGFWCQTEASHAQALWYGRIVRLIEVMGHLEPSDLLWSEIEADLGACTQAYLAKDVLSWRMYVCRIKAKVWSQTGPLECRPVWC
jgi:hypothetical protein